MTRDYIDKWAAELLDLAKDNWGNLLLLEKILEELKLRTSKAGRDAHEQVVKRVSTFKCKSHDSFKWPSTDAPAGQYGFSGEEFWYQQGLLRFVGYKVGINGEPSSIRKQILKCVLFNDIPKVNSLEYMQEWGVPRTSTRLKKMAESIASFTRNAKRRTDNYQAAIDDWEADLQFLFENYYHPRLGFCWPSTNN